MEVHYLSVAAVMDEVRYRLGPKVTTEEVASVVCHLSDDGALRHDGKGFVVDLDRNDPEVVLGYLMQGPVAMA